MKKNSIVAAVFTLGIFCISLDIVSDDGKAGSTGSPGENTCNTAGCHTGNVVNDAAGSIIIDCPDMTNWKYVPGETYQVNVTITKTGINLFGFGFEALTASGANAGSFSITNSAETTTKNANVGGNLRTNVVHKLNGGASTDTHTFTFNWNAPTTDIGTITFYTAANCANANNATSGDFIYKTSQTVTSPATSFLDKNIKKQSFSIFPNPAHKSLNVSYLLKETSNVSMKLISLNGQTVYVNQMGKQFAGKQLHIIDFNQEIVPGVYYMEILSEKESFVQKIILN
jgi:hypothetical protein